MKLFIAATASVILAGGSPTFAQDDYFRFRDLAPEMRLNKVLDAEGFYTHAAAWGDADGDGWLDLFAGTMAGKKVGPPHSLFWNNKGKLVHDPQKALERWGRAAGCAFVDLDNDGLLELYVSMHSRGDDLTGPGLPNLLYRARPGRIYEEVKDSGASPRGFTGRCVATLDYDGDGLLDLFVPSRPGKDQRGFLFHNKGNLKFERANREAGLPESISGLGVTSVDLTGNGWPDLFVGGSNRLFLNRGDGTFREATELKPLLGREHTREDLSTSCGVSFGDVNRDGRPDLVIGTHPKRPWNVDPMPVRLYINKGATVGRAKFEEVTEQAGLRKIWMKAPHVVLRDFDNDGLPDLMTSVVVFKGEQVHPLIYKNMGGPVGGAPRFKETALRHQPDFPTEADRKSGGEFYDTVGSNTRVFYFPVGPSGDFDNDGRLDIFFDRGWPYIPARLLRNETAGGHWLDVQVSAGRGMNRQGIGAVVRAFKAGRAGDPEALIYTEEIAVGYGYSSGQPAIAHLGLGRESTCDLEIVWPHGKGKTTKRGVKADQRLTVSP